MLLILLVRWAILAVAIAIAAAIVPSVDVDGGFLGLVGVALVFGLVNALIGPVLRLLSLPLTLITFGLFSLVVNGVLLAITAGLVDNLDVGGFLSTMLAALLIAISASVMTIALQRATGS